MLGDLSLIRPLTWAGIPVVVGTDDGADPALWSMHVKRRFLVPGYGVGARDRAAAVLLAVGERLARRHGQRLPLFYGQDAQLALLYQAREALARHFAFLINDEPLGPALLDKEEFARLCRRKGVRTPRTCRLDAPLAELRQLEPPLLVKPRLKTDWHGLRDAVFPGHAKARVFPDLAALLEDAAVRRARDGLIAQECLDAPVGALYSFHGFASEDGRLLASFCGRKVKTYPPFAGESAVIELVDDPAVAEAGREVLARLGVVGPFKIDFVRDVQRKDLVTLEVNARFNLWDHLGAAHGVNLLQVAYDYLMFGRTPAPVPYRPRARWVSFYRTYRGFKDAGASRLGALVRWMALALRRPAVHDVLDWRDPAPFVRLLATLLWPRRRSRRAWQLA